MTNDELFESWDNHDENRCDVYNCQRISAWFIHAEECTECAETVRILIEEFDGNEFDIIQFLDNEIENQYC